MISFVFQRGNFDAFCTCTRAGVRANKPLRSGLSMPWQIEGEDDHFPVDLMLTAVFT